MRRPPRRYQKQVSLRELEKSQSLGFFKTRSGIGARHRQRRIRPDTDHFHVQLVELKVSVCFALVPREESCSAEEGVASATLADAPPASAPRPASGIRPGFCTGAGAGSGTAVEAPSPWDFDGVSGDSRDPVSGGSDRAVPMSTAGSDRGAAWVSEAAGDAVCGTASGRGLASVPPAGATLSGDCRRPDSSVVEPAVGCSDGASGFSSPRGTAFFLPRPPPRRRRFERPLAEGRPLSSPGEPSSPDSGTPTAGVSSATGAGAAPSPPATAGALRSSSGPPAWEAPLAVEAPFASDCAATPPEGPRVSADVGA